MAGAQPLEALAINTLLERAGLRTGAPSMGAFLFGAWVSGTLGDWNSPPVMGDRSLESETDQVVHKEKDR